MNKKEQKFITSIYNDCLALKRRGELTEFGQGQMILCKMLLKMKKNNPKSY
ncbi:MAG: hypothetical protein KJ939_00895 [Nanoarchaeota archaeon]|nr:hypothetical protein [Nanoarchaeota archaeon]